MDEKLLDGDDTPNLESLHKVRLTALLNDLMKRGKLEAAQILGVNHKTLTAALDSGVLTPRLSDALEKVLLSREIEAFEKVRERVDELVGRLEAVEGRTGNIGGEIGEAVRREVERRVAEWTESPGGAEERSTETTTRAEGDGADAAAHEERQPRSRRHSEEYRQMHPSVITMEPQPGDEEVFGEAGPLVDEWRRLRQSHPAEGRGVAWLTNEERLRVLEIALVGEHEMAMPPSRYRWDSFERRSQVRWRTETLERVRRELVWAHVRRWIRRILTFNLWWD